MANKSKKRNKSKRHPGKKQLEHKAYLSNEKHRALRLITYDITFEPLENTSIPKEVQDEMENLVEKSLSSPKSIIGSLEEFINKYPNVPQLYNLISVAYSNLNEKEKSKYYAEKNYKNNPDYLFAKLNYAEICMLEGDYEKVPEILDNKFDIKMLYPGRDVFHVTEVVGFMGVTGLYFAHIGKQEQAEVLYNCLKELAPEHPLTKKLKQKLFIESIKGKLHRLIGKG